MYRSLFKGSETLNRHDENCIYNLDYEIPRSNCSNHFAEDTTIVGEQVVSDRGVCGVSGLCECLPGYTGVTDWVNVDNKDCPIFMPGLQWDALYRGCLGAILLILQGVRLIFKTYKQSWDRDKNFKALLRKASFLIALHMINMGIPLLILSVSKAVAPEKLILDPTANPVFYFYFFLAYNSEWWMFAILFCSLITTMLQGINREADRDVVLLGHWVNKITRRVPYIDLVTRMVTWIIPGLIGGANKNVYNLTVISAFNYFIYGLLKFVTYPWLWIRAVYLVLNLSTRKLKERQSKFSGSTAHNKLKSFRRMVQMFVSFFCLCCFTNVFIILTYLSTGPHYYPELVWYIICQRGDYCFLYCVGFEILYFGLVEKIRLCWERQRLSLSQRLSSVFGDDEGEGGNDEVTDDVDKDTFEMSNPISNSKGNKV